MRLGIFNLAIVTTASLAASVLAVAVGAALGARERLDRLWGWVFVALSATTLVLTFSRAAWVLGVGGVLILGLRADRRRFFRLVPVVLVVVAVLLAVPQVSARVDDFFRADEGSTVGHVELWGEAAAMANAHPLLGSGPYAFMQRNGADAEADPTHNFVLEAAADTGWPGAVLVVALAGGLLVWGWRRLRGRSLLAVSVWVALLVAVGMNLTMNGFREGPFWIWAGLLTALAMAPAAAGTHAAPVEAAAAA